MQALATPSRVRILTRLASRPRSVSELARELEMEQPAVSQQLRELGLVIGERRGRQVIYALDDDHVAVLLTEAVVHTHHLNNNHANRPRPRRRAPDDRNPSSSRNFCDDSEAGSTHPALTPRNARSPAARATLSRRRRARTSGAITPMPSDCHGPLVLAPANGGRRQARLRGAGGEARWLPREPPTIGPRQLFEHQAMIPPREQHDLLRTSCMARTYVGATATPVHCYEVTRARCRAPLLQVASSASAAARRGDRLGIARGLPTARDRGLQVGKSSQPILLF